LSISEIVRRTGLSRNTVKSWLKAGEGTVPKYRRHEAMTVLAPYRDRLLQWLELDARRAQRDRRTAVTDTTLRNAALTLGCAPR
jgi:transposase